MPRPLAVAVVAVVCLAFAPVAGAQEPSCTLVVAKDTVLDRDISCGDDAGVEIAAPNVTLDLAGHTVFGRVAIRNQGHDNVTIENGVAIGEGLYAISISHADRNTIRNMTVEDFIQPALVLTDSDNSRIFNNRITGYAGGIRLWEGSDRNVVYGNDASGMYSGIGVSASNYNLIVANAARTDVDVALAVGSGTGNSLAFNTVSAASTHAIYVGVGGRRTVLLGNRASGTENDGLDGIHNESRSTVLIANTANDNADYGIESVPGVIAFGNRASGNGNPAQCLNVRCR